MKQLDETLLDLLIQVTGKERSDLERAIEIPPKLDQGDRALPCFRWAKAAKKAPLELAKAWKKALLAQELPPEVEKVEVARGYLNIFFKRGPAACLVLKEIFSEPGRYGFVSQDPQSLSIVEFSSPNIAKPFSIGHLRSTNIGASLARVLKARGWHVIQMNHLGDWGTQFGKLLAAYRRWGSAEGLDQSPIAKLYKLYVRFHEEEVSDPTLIEEAREWFSKLEQQDEEARELWSWFRELTLRELKQLYKKLSVDFDHNWGESFYIDRLPELVETLAAKGISKVSDDATVIDLEEYNLRTCLVKKSDESSLYMTRDIAAAIYRYEQFKFQKMIYVVGNPQQLHFQQLFKILELMGHGWAKDCEHVSFGHISFGDEGMSTRKGNVVFLSEVLDRAIEMARKIVEEKNPELEDQDRVAEAVGLGAILFADLSSKRIKDVRFSWEDILSFEGETGPYLQYTLVRALSVMRRYDHEIEISTSTETLVADEEAAVIRSLSRFPLTLARAEREREPFLVAQYLINLASDFNRFYSVHRILDAEPEVTAARMLLVSGVAEVLKAGLKLLGIPVLERM